MSVPWNRSLGRMPESLVPCDDGPDAPICEESGRSRGTPSTEGAQATSLIVDAYHWAETAFGPRATGWIGRRYRASTRRPARACDYVTNV